MLVIELFLNGLNDLYNISNYYKIPIYNLISNSKLIGVIISFFNLFIHIIELLFK